MQAVIRAFAAPHPPDPTIMMNLCTPRRRDRAGAERERARAGGLRERARVQVWRGPRQLGACWTRVDGLHRGRGREDD
eukprot:203204-Rhodomonas_salina.1